jgi:cyclophilin family peptidyl-prolyl cis-trans isomerase
MALGVLLLLLSTSESLRLPSASSITRRAALAAALVAAPPLAANAAGAIRAGDQGSVGADGRLVLNDPNAGSINVLTSPAKVTSRCYLDISVGGASAGRIVIDLYGEIAPKTAENFRQLCSGEAGFGYAGTSFFKVLSELTLQAGAIEGHGSIYGPTFAHENYDIKHNVAGLVSMVNSGVGGSSGLSDSRFLIQLADDAGYLDGRYVAFGRVTEGMGVVRRIESVRVSGTKKAPVDRVSIDAAGVLAPPLPPPAAAPQSES